MGRRRDLESALAAALKEGFKLGRSQAFEQVLNSAATQVLNEETDEAIQIVLEEGTGAAVSVFGGAVGAEYRERWRRTLTPVLGAVSVAATEEAAPTLGAFRLSNPRMREYLDSYVSQLANTLPKTSYENFKRVLDEAIDDGLSVPKTVERLREYISDLTKTRAALIARTELLNASRGATHMQVTQSGVPLKGKAWRTSQDSRVRPDHRAMEGEIVKANEAFSNGEVYPSSPRCRCTVEYLIDYDALKSVA